MTTNRQRAAIVSALMDHYGDPFEVHAYRDEVTVSFPIWIEPGRFTVGHYRYATGVALRSLDGRKPVTDEDLTAIISDVTAQFRRGVTDARFTDQARAGYAVAVAALPTEVTTHE